MLSLPNELHQVPKEGGSIWKKTIDKSLKFSKRLSKISKAIKAKKSKASKQSVKQECADDRLLIKTALEVLESFREFFGPTSNFVSKTNLTAPIK